MARPSYAERESQARELNEKQLAFAVWFATPAPLRQPQEMKDLADVLGVSRQAMWRWSKDPRVLDAARYVVLQNAGEPGKVSQVLDMLHDSAISKRDMKSAELWLKAVGVMAAQTNRDLALWDNVSDEALDSLSDEALLALKAAKEAEAQEREAIERARRAVAATGVEVPA